MLDAVIRRLNELEKRVQMLEVTDGAPDALVVVDGVTAPTAVAGLALIYVDTNTGDLMCRFGDGITKTIVTDT